MEFLREKKNLYYDFSLVRRWESSNAGEDRGFWLISNTCFFFLSPLSSFSSWWEWSDATIEAEEGGEGEGRLRCASPRQFWWVFRHVKHSFTRSLEAPGERVGCRSIHSLAGRKIQGAGLLLDAHYRRYKRVESETWAAACPDHRGPFGG